MNVIGYTSAVPNVVIEPKSKSSSNILTAGINAFINKKFIIYIIYFTS